MKYLPFAGICGCQTDKYPSSCVIIFSHVYSIVINMLGCNCVIYARIIDLCVKIKTSVMLPVRLEQAGRATSLLQSALKLINDDKKGCGYWTWLIMEWNVSQYNTDMLSVPEVMSIFNHNRSHENMSSRVHSHSIIFFYFIFMSASVY